MWRGRRAAIAGRGIVRWRWAREFIQQIARPLLTRRAIFPNAGHEIGTPSMATGDGHENDQRGGQRQMLREVRPACHQATAKKSTLHLALVIAR